MVFSWGTKVGDDVVDKVGFERENDQVGADSDR
jgi:hypothetical protein